MYIGVVTPCKTHVTPIIPKIIIVCRIVKPHDIFEDVTHFIRTSWDLQGPDHSSQTSCNARAGFVAAYLLICSKPRHQPLWGASSYVNNWERSKFTFSKCRNTFSLKVTKVDHWGNARSSSGKQSDVVFGGTTNGQPRQSSNALLGHWNLWVLIRPPFPCPETGMPSQIDLGHIQKQRAHVQLVLLLAKKYRKVMQAIAISIEPNGIFS